MKCFKLLILCSLVQLVCLQGVGSGLNGNLRLCIVEARGTYKRAGKFCPILDEEQSGVECVIGTDRLDCLRRISKGTVDFGPFSPEDLIAAQWANIDVLVTNEIPHRQRSYERTVVAVVNRRILPDSSWSLEAVLRNTSLCHPGNGVNDLRPLSDTLAGYLESLVIARSCESGLSLSENRIKAVSQFFSKACKAGPWVPDQKQDAELKLKYSNLCEACETPSCDANDRYWGVTGALTCLLEGAGDVMWGNLDDVLAYFGLDSQSNQHPSSDNFAYLCRDGTWQPLKDNPKPCVWLNRPWPIVAAKRKTAAAVSKLVSSLQDGALFDGHWHGALSSLLEVREAPTPLYPPRAPLDHLATARGFREAYSQNGCDPPRHINVCTSSLLEKNKCEWMSEAASVYGVTPPFQCLIRDGVAGCLRSVQLEESDVTIVDSDWLVSAMRDYKLKPIMHEVTPIMEQMDTVFAYVRKNENINKMADLRGKRAAFPRFDGFAWHSVIKYLNNEQNGCTENLNDYFSEICAPGIEKYNFTEEVVKKYTKTCYGIDRGLDDGEKAGFLGLIHNKTDVAFASIKTYNSYKVERSHGPAVGIEIIPLCLEENKKYCYIKWANIGHIMTIKNLTSVRSHEIKNVFGKLDQLFGTHQPFHNPMFSLYGPFSHNLDVLFKNNTKRLATDKIFETHPYVGMPLNFEGSLVNDTFDSCHLSHILALNFAPKSAPVVAILTLLTVVSSFLLY
ncbi:unnamed protein product [Leptidea sinapis]|uniref:Transferrin-like domain-containing protein n=1 Tax=Leptidea sinapis TaxID=189913 RepID=A0A5E4R1P8_9NEOP|nr:unnamed protein product [Leptidea sinapis]